MLPRLSIARRLSLLLGGLLLAVSLVLTAGLYRETRRAALDGAAARLTASSRDLAGLLSANVPRLLADARALGRLPEVTALMRPGAGAADAPTSLTRLLAGPRPLYAIELWDTAGARRIALGAALPPLPDSAARQLAARALADSGSAVGAFRAVADSTVYPVIGVVGEPGETRGYVVLWLRGASTPQAARQITQLAGEFARVLVGAPPAWSDFSIAVTGPPAEQLARGGLMEYDRSDVGRVLAAAAPVPRTEWRVVVEFPRPQILAAPRRFLVRAVMLVVLVSLVGVGAVWLISRSVTRPLIAVTHAAETIAGGQYQARVPVEAEGGDEAGRLAAAFNAMAAQVERSEHALRTLNAELERRVAQRTVELQDANHELEAFSYSVSHDLRAPLRAIDGFSRILAEEHAGPLGAEGARLAGVIRTNTARMAALIDDLLALSRLGRQALAIRPVDVAELVREVVDEARAAEPARAVTVEIGDLGTRPGDRALLRHVFQNLVSNAFKFTRQVAAPRITIGVDDVGGDPALFVRDNGAGFDPRYADKLFGVFQRLHRAEEFEGTGVGLAIVQRIVHRHGGRIWAEGAPGQGATFHFTLPVETPPA